MAKSIWQFETPNSFEILFDLTFEIVNYQTKDKLISYLELVAFIFTDDVGSQVVKFPL